MRERVRVSVLAVVSAVVFYYIASGLFGATLKVGGGVEERDMTVVDVVVITVASSILAILAATLLQRLRRGREIWLAVATLVLVVSMASLGQVDLSTADVIWQGLLHAVFGLLLVIGFYVGWPRGDA